MVASCKFAGRKLKVLPPNCLFAVCYRVRRDVDSSTRIKSLNIVLPRNICVIRENHLFIVNCSLLIAHC